MTNDPFADSLGSPELDPSVFLAPGCHVLGQVRIGAESSVWFGAVIRGDEERIEIGSRTNVQDLCCLHADADRPCILGDRVSLGHAAIVHGAVVEDDVLIGMRAVVLNGARIGTGSIVAAGAVVTEGTQIPPGSVVMGMPASVQRPVTDRDRQRIAHAAQHYVEFSRRYLGLRS